MGCTSLDEGVDEWLDVSPAREKNMQLTNS